MTKAIYTGLLYTKCEPVSDSRNFVSVRILVPRVYIYTNTILHDDFSTGSRVVALENSFG